MKANEIFAGEVGPGWSKLVDPLLEQCKAEGVQVLQVKEKFGGLRFYVAGGESPALAQAIERAESESTRTCELCGEPGRIRGGIWRRTRCDEHAEERA